jgi:hypothetical protein
MLPMKDEEVTRTEASFVGGKNLVRGRHSRSSPDSHFASLPISMCMWAALRLHLGLAPILHVLK